MKKKLNILLLHRILMLVFFYFILRVFFTIYNREYLPEISIEHFLYLSFSGLSFDMWAIAYVNILYIFCQTLPIKFKYNIGYQKVLKYWFIITNSIAILVNCVDSIYFPFRSRRTTWSVFEEFAGDTENKGIFLGLFKDYFWILFIWIFFVVLMVAFYGTTKVDRPQQKHYYIRSVAIMFLSLLLTFVCMRGTFGDRPLSLNHASRGIKNPVEANIVLNTTFTLLKTINKSGEKQILYFDDHTAKRFFNPIKEPKSENMIPKNIMIIILEGFGKQVIGFYNKDIPNFISYTPFIDSIASVSLTYKYSYSNGRGSIEASPAILAGIPSILKSSQYVTSIYSNNDLHSLPYLLRKEGYSTAFFHGAPDGSMRLKEFSDLIGIENYYGQQAYNNDKDFDGHWGIWDEPFLIYTANTINTFKSPFISVIFSLTSHQPFRIPDKYIDRFEGGEAPILKAIQYTDYALKCFFETASQMSWYDSTLFIITGDHTNTYISNEKYATAVGTYEVPIIFYDPSQEINAHYDTTKVVQHKDVMPTVLDYLKYPKKYLSFGSSIYSDNNFAINYVGSEYELIKSGKVFFTDLNGIIRYYDLNKDSLIHNNLIQNTLEQENIKIMDSIIKSYNQQFFDRLINNKFTDY